MSPNHGIEQLSQRIAALEHSLGELKQDLARLQAAAPSVGTSAAIEAAPSLSTPPPVSEIFSEIRIPATGEVPMRAPPVIAAVEMPPMSIEAPATPSPLPPFPAPEPSGPSWREWLEPLQLWPPSGEENAEVRLAAWWATRVGALLAVIGVVFLGVYVSREAAPWVRLSEVVLVAGGVIGLGTWLDRRLPKFGAVLFGAGLALAYFCAFAAYAVAPMKVIERPSVAALAELAVVAGIFAAAWRRGSPVVATMAVALGHVTAFLALRAGPVGFGPWVVLTLGLAAVALHWFRQWSAPSFLAMPLAWANLIVASSPWSRSPGLAVTPVWVWSLLFFALYLVRDWVPASRGETIDRAARIFQVSNSSLGFLVALAVTGATARGKLMPFYFGAGVVFFIATWLWQRVGLVHTLVPIFACKAAGLIALGVIAAFDGPARYLVLLAQAFVMLVSARQSAVGGLRIATVVTGALALGFFMAELRPEHAPVAAHATGVELVFLTGSIAFVAALHRWLGVSSTYTVLGGLIVGLAAISTVATWEAASWRPIANVATALVLCATAGGLRRWLGGGVAAALLLVAAHFEVWRYNPGVSGRGMLWANEVVLFLVAAGGALGVRRWSNVNGRGVVRSVIGLLAGVTLIRVGYVTLEPTAALALTALVSLGFTASIYSAREWPIAHLSAVLLALGAVFFMLEDRRGASFWYLIAGAAVWAAPAFLATAERRGATFSPAGLREPTAWALGLFATAITLLAVVDRVSSQLVPLTLCGAGILLFVLAWRPGFQPALEGAWVLTFSAALWILDRNAPVGLDWLGFAFAWLPVLALSRSPDFGALAEPPPGWRAHAPAVQVALATGVGVMLAVSRHGVVQLGAFGMVAAVNFAFWRSTRATPLRSGFLVVVLLSWVAAWRFAEHAEARQWGGALAAVLAVGAAVTVGSLLVDREFDARVRRRLRWLTSVAALALFLHALQGQRGALGPYTTVGWGLVAVATFLLGLFARSRAHRLTGLSGLALCVGRAFMIDLNSTLHRIAAFVAIGIVLLWVGFSYHRFRHLITDEEKKL